jgi:hypothetical protein
MERRSSELEKGMKSGWFTDSQQYTINLIVEEIDQNHIMWTYGA